MSRAEGVLKASRSSGDPLCYLSDYSHGGDPEQAGKDLRQEFNSGDTPRIP